MRACVLTSRKRRRRRRRRFTAPSRAINISASNGSHDYDQRGWLRWRGRRKSESERASESERENASMCVWERERERENHHIRARGVMHVQGMYICICTYTRVRYNECAHGWIVCMCANVLRPVGEGGQVGTLPGDGSCLPPREFIVLRSRAPPLRLHRFEATLRVHFFRLLRARAAATRASVFQTTPPRGFALLVIVPMNRDRRCERYIHTSHSGRNGDGTWRCFQVPRTKGARPLGAALVRDFNRLFRVVRLQSSLLGNYRRLDLRYFKLCQRVFVINKKMPFKIINQ